MDSLLALSCSRTPAISAGSISLDSTFKGANKKLNIKKFCLLLFAGTFTSFFKDKKVNKKSQNSRNQGFVTIFAR
jgi:hypothetical protein